ncbi:hypothetical protein DW682_04735 [Collinsella intestinalis]|uniref:Uncharacterized protein n=1 Tax=Collinsella intestinalis TaxID=147207 RepID=A0A414NGU2_9ACTN|nr:hypothetical protein DW682_04735 [Collinsella intestinalis]
MPEAASVKATTPSLRPSIVNVAVPSSFLSSLILAMEPSTPPKPENEAATFILTDPYSGTETARLLETSAPGAIWAISKCVKIEASPSPSQSRSTEPSVRSVRQE